MLKGALLLKPSNSVDHSDTKAQKELVLVVSHLVVFMFFFFRKVSLYLVFQLDFQLQEFLSSLQPLFSRFKVNAKILTDDFLNVLFEILQNEKAHE